MKYISTRGQAPALSFEDAMLTGLARDGGLYVPATIPTMNAAEIAGTRAAHLRDGAAVSRFLAWLDANGPSGEIDEIAAARRLERPWQIMTVPATPSSGSPPVAA